MGVTFGDIEGGGGCDGLLLLGSWVAVRDAGVRDCLVFEFVAFVFFLITSFVSFSLRWVEVVMSARLVPGVVAVFGVLLCVGAVSSCCRSVCDCASVVAGFDR